MTTTQKDAPQAHELVSSELATSLFDGESCGESGDAHDISPAVQGRNRLSIFGGWCRLLVCLALLATAQQCFRNLLSPGSPATQPQFVQHSVPQHPVPQPEATATAVSIPQFMVDVNRAPQHELEALPEVGTSLATRIVDYRQTQGPFHQIDDLLQVRGVGPRTLEQLRPMLLVRPPEEPVEY